MEYDVFKEIDDHCESLLKLSRFDILQTVGEIETSNWTEQQLLEIRIMLEEKIEKLNDLERRFATEVKMNANEEEKLVAKYFSTLDEDLTMYLEAMLKMVKFWEHEKFLNQNYISIDSLKKVVRILQEFIDTLHFYEPVPRAELIKEFTPRLIYLQFSGIIDIIRKSLEEKLDKAHISNVRLAETLALITGENQITIEKLLSKLSHLTAGNPHPVFTAGMIGTAITNLEIDGFDTSQLTSILEKMHQ